VRIRLAGPVDEQRHGLGPVGALAGRGQRERRQPVPGLAGDADRLPAGGQDPHVIRGEQHLPDEVRDRREDVLAVVDHQQELPPRQ